MGFSGKVKSWLCEVVYFVEKEMLEPFVRHENFQYRVHGNNQRLSTMDYDGGQITNNIDVKIVEGHVVENRFQAVVFKLLKFTQYLRRKLDVRPQYS